MNRARVYLWTPDPTHPGGGSVRHEVVELPRLERSAEGGQGLRGRYVIVHNGAVINFPTANSCEARPVGDAVPDCNGDFLFEPGRGGGRLDRMPVAPEGRRRLYIETSHFGETNTYFHLDRIARYIDGLLAELRDQPLPPVRAIVHAHHGAVECHGVRDGVRRRGAWVPFQGGHYRLPSWRYDVQEFNPIHPDGEIHLGAGRRRLPFGALACRVGRRYRHNAAHNAGIIYHEYGHHIHRHTADFRANKMRPRSLQSNRKVALDEGTCDYWAAVMLDCPHVWAWHRRHDGHYLHPRSLASGRTMKDYREGREADPHANGTIWGSSLWDLRGRLSAGTPGGGRLADLIVLKALLLTGHVVRKDRPATCRARSRFRTMLGALLAAEQVLCNGRWRNEIASAFADRGIRVRRRGAPA
jgi:hypothetical protein